MKQHKFSALIKKIEWQMTNCESELQQVRDKETQFLKKIETIDNQLEKAAFISKQLINPEFEMIRTRFYSKTSQEKNRMEQKINDIQREIISKKNQITELKSQLKTLQRFQNNVSLSTQKEVKRKEEQTLEELILSRGHT